MNNSPKNRMPVGDKIRFSFQSSTFHLYYFKRKKEKKESLCPMWKVSKKQVFRMKYYPIGFLKDEI